MSFFLRNDRIRGHSDTLGDCAKHTLQYGSFSRLSFDSMLTTVGVKLTDNATPASSTSSTSHPFLLYDVQSPLFLDDRTQLIFAQQRFGRRFFHFCCLFVHKGWCASGRAAARIFVKEVAWYSSFCNGAFGVCASLLAYWACEKCSSASTKITLRTYFL